MSKSRRGEIERENSLTLNMWRTAIPTSPIERRKRRKPRGTMCPGLPRKNSFVLAQYTVAAVLKTGFYERERERIPKSWNDILVHRKQKSQCCSQ
jgi:hypothetical protein